MKQTLLILLLAPLCACAQIQVNEPTPQKKVIGTQKYGNKLHSELSYRVYEKDTIYSIAFRNAAYNYHHEFNSFSFRGDTTLSQFYEILKSFFAEDIIKKKGHAQTLTIGKTQVTITTSGGGRNYIVVGPENLGYFTLTKKQLEKLFSRE